MFIFIEGNIKETVHGVPYPSELSQLSQLCRVTNMPYTDATFDQLNHLDISI